MANEENPAKLNKRVEDLVDDLETRIPGTIEPQTGDSYARLGAPTGASVSADIAAVKTDTAAILVDTGDGTDAAVAPGTAGSLHGHIRESQEQADLIYSRLGAPAGASVSADIAAVKTDTAAIVLATDTLEASATTISNYVDTLETISGANTDAATDPSAGTGTLFSKIRGAGDDLDTIITSVGAAADAAVEPDGGAGSLHAKVAGLGDQLEVPTADSTANTLERDVIGNKSDVGSAASTASLVALARLLVDTYAATTGTADSGTTTTMVDTERTEAAASDLEGQMLIFTSGNNDRVGRIIVDFDPATDTITVAPAFADAIAAGDKYVIIPADFSNALDLALNATGVAIATNSLADQLYIGAAEQLRNFVAKTGGTAVVAGKSLADYIGNPTGDTLASLTAKLGDNDDAATDPSAASGNVLSKLRGAGEDLDAIYSRIGAPTGASVSADIAAVKTDTAAIVLATDELEDDVNTLRDAAISAPTANTIEDQLFVGAGEQLRNFVAKTGGTAIATGKSLVDALGTNGTTVTDSAVSVLGAIGADNNNNAFASTNVAANRDGSVLERTEQIIQTVGIWTGPTNTGAVTCATAAETTLLEVTGITAPTQVIVTLNLKNLTANATLAVYEHVSSGAGTEYQKIDPTHSWTTSDQDGFRIEFNAIDDYKITITTGAEGANRDVYVYHARRVMA